MKICGPSASCNTNFYPLNWFHLDNTELLSLHADSVIQLYVSPRSPVAFAALDENMR